MNRFFSYLNSFIPGTLIRAEEVNSVFQAIEAGFDIANTLVPPEFVGDYQVGATYTVNQIFKDPDTKSLYYVRVEHTAVSIASDLAGQRISLIIDLTQVSASTAQAVASAAAALQSELNAFASMQTAVNAPGTSATSTTSQALSATSPRTFTIQTGKAFAIGQFVTIAYRPSPGNYFIAQITGYNSTTGQLDVSIQSFAGTGTFADWSIALTALNQLAITNDSTNLDYNLVLTKDTGALLYRDTGLNLKYNPSTDTLTVPNIAGTISSAAKLSTPRTIALTGDVVGSVLFDGSANASISTVIQPDSVQLGTDTTGNYVAAVALTGTGLTISNTGLEGGTYTINSTATSNNTINTLVFRDASGNFSAGTITATLNGTASVATSATNATNVSGGTVSATTGAFSGNLALATQDTLHQSLGSVSGTVTLSAGVANYFSVTASASITFSLVGAPAATRMTAIVLELTNGGNFTITWPATVKWALGAAPRLTTSGTDILIFITDDAGTTWRAVRTIEDSR